MAEAAGVGVALDSGDAAFLFGENQGRYLTACGFEQADWLMGRAGREGVPVKVVGEFGGDSVTLGSLSAPLDELSSAFRSRFGEEFG